jgi:hypothetical protein
MKPPTLLYVLKTVTRYEGVSKSFRTESNNEIYAYNKKHSLRSNTKGYSSKTHRLTHEKAIQLHLVAENCTIYRSRYRRPVRKLLDTPSYAFFLEYLLPYITIHKSNFRNLL